MWMHWQRGVIFLAFFAAGLSGCKRGEVAPEADPEDVTHLSDKTEMVLADWLALPRDKLAEMVKETQDTAISQQTAAREAGEGATLLPKLRPQVAAPVLGADPKLGAQYSAKMQFSLPRYVKEGTFDADLALHLARFGDREAALKLADPKDENLLKLIDSVAPSRNYPVEWSQLVGLRLQLAQLKLAHGESKDALEGASDLVLLHKQLVELLDKKAANGPLGAALLPIGRGALSDAAVAWRTSEQKKTVVAEDIDAALKTWGEVPTFVGPAIGPGAKAEAVAHLMGSPVRGRTVSAQTPSAVRRSLDLLGLPVVQENVQNVVAFFDIDGKLTEFIFVYTDGTKRTHSEPITLAGPLVDLGFKALEVQNTGRMPSQSFTGGGLIYDVKVTSGSSALGAFVRVGAEKAPAATFAARDLRDFGSLHLDRSFEHNRTGTVPEANSDKKFQINRVLALASITLPVTDLKPIVAIVERKGDLDLVESVSFQWSNEHAVNLIAVSKILVPLWATFGPARIESVVDTTHGHLAFVWENETTRLTLQLPYKAEEGIELKAVDRRGDDVIKDRLAATAKFDKDERDAHWKAEKWQTRLGRGLPGSGVEQIQLGLPKAEVQKLLAALPETRLAPMADGGFNLLYFSNPAAGVTFWPRQVFVRFDKDNQVSEVRVRYQDGVVPPSKDRPALLDVLKKTNGSPEKLAPTWSGIWTDFPGTRPATHFRWIDERTLVTFQRDAATMEVTLRDCPADAPRGADVGPLSLCSRGIEGCQLGDKRAELLKRWKIEKPTLVGDGVLVSPAEGQYDAVVVYFEDGAEGRAIKILGQYRKRLQVPDASQAIMEAWSADLDHLGAVRRQDVASGSMLQAWTWHDDRTRVRIFGQQTESGPRLYCEWRELPIPAVKTTKK